MFGTTGLGEIVSGAETGFVSDNREWARRVFGAVHVPDARLRRRIVRVAAHMASVPGATLPQQMGGHAALTAVYRLLNNARVSREALSAPHWQETRLLAGAESVVLMVQDITTLDYTRYAGTMQGLGPIGDGRGRGLLLHSTLAVIPKERRVLGLAHQQAFHRVALREGEARRSRPKAQRESRVWGEAVQAIGRPPAGTRWVVVADRQTDDTAFLLTCRSQGYDFTIRLGYGSRVIVQGHGPHQNLRDTAQTWAPVAQIAVAVRGKGGRPGRTAQVLVSCGQVRLLTPRREAPLDVWVIRAWEIDVPEGAQRLEWLLASSVSVNTPQEAVERVEWYRARWIVEDYHQCLKSGCEVERRDLGNTDKIERLIGLVAPIAVRLLQLRDRVRGDPQMPASEIVDEMMVRILAVKLQVSAKGMTAREFWRGVARLGGFLGRKSDGEPGWKTLWRGWIPLQNMLEGARIAAQLVHT